VEIAHSSISAEIDTWRPAGPASEEFPVRRWRDSSIADPTTPGFQARPLRAVDQIEDRAQQMSRTVESAPVHKAPREEIPAECPDSTKPSFSSLRLQAHNG